MNNRSMRIFLVLGSLMLALFAQPLAAQSLDALAAKFHQRCDELKQKQLELEQSAESSLGSDAERKTASAAAGALGNIIAKINTALAEQSHATSASAKEVALASIQSNIVGGNVIASAAESQLGLIRSDAVAQTIAEKISIVGLREKISRFDGAKTYAFDDGGFTGTGVGSAFFGAGEQTQLEVQATYTRSTPESAEAIVKHDRSVGGGVMLEDTAAGLERVSSVHYDGRFNALVMNNHLVYLMKVPTWGAAALSRAIAQDNDMLVGVSLGTQGFIFGQADQYENTDVSRSLFLADRFLGDIVFGWHQWTAAYKFPDGYEPKAGTTKVNMLVRFAFKSFRFAQHGNELALANLAVDVTMMPVSDKRAGNGGMLPDMEALARGYEAPAPFIENANYFTSHFNFFRRERLISRTISYGELAALLRSYKLAGVDLATLAKELEAG